MLLKFSPSSSILASFLLLFNFSAFSQPVVSTIESDLKAQQQIVFQNGKMYLLDIYDVKRIPVAQSGTVSLKLKQYKLAENNQSCGTLGNKFFRIETSKEGLELNQTLFDEFIVAINYLSKFRSSWETMKVGKSKFFQYDFDKDAKLIMDGNKDDIRFAITKDNKSIFITSNLKEIDAFSEAVNDLKRFAANQRMDECL